MGGYTFFDDEHLHAIQQQLHRNLQRLLLQASKFGPLYIPTPLSNEIDDTKAALQEINEEIARRTTPVASSGNLAVVPSSPSQPTVKEDWDGAVDSDTVYGRHQESIQLTQAILEDHCRIVMIVGIGGIGKTTLSLHVARMIKDTFTHVFWRSLRNNPPIDIVLGEFVRFVSDNQILDLPEKLDEQLLLTVKLLKEHKCLIMFDNIESLLRDGYRGGVFREGYEGLVHDI